MLADPIASVLIGIVLIIGSRRVTRDSLHIFMEDVLKGLSVAQLMKNMSGVPGIIDVHGLHIWNIFSGHTILSAHVALADQSLNQVEILMGDIKDHLQRDFGIGHTTIQFECRNCSQCILAEDSERALEEPSEEQKSSPIIVCPDQSP